jgi:hypothetical protein
MGIVVPPAQLVMVGHQAGSNLLNDASQPGRTECATAHVRNLGNHLRAELSGDRADVLGH